MALRPPPPGSVQVFRNIFDSKKYVEHYRASDMEAELGLTQDRLVALALLLGSDYTEGVSGIGIVNATEVVMAFLPADEGQPLGRGQGWEAFKEWVVSPDVELIQGAAKEQGRRRAQCSSGATQVILPPSAPVRRQLLSGGHAPRAGQASVGFSGPARARGAAPLRGRLARSASLTL